MRLFEVSREFFGIACEGGTRSTGELTCAVVHQTGGPSARSGAAFLHTKPDGSVHMVGDSDECYQLANRTKIACGVSDVNSWTWHYENGFPFSLKLTGWLKNLRALRRCAWHIARILVAEKLPLKYLTTEDFNAGNRRGWTYHRNLSLSSVSSSTHVDPVNFPHLRFKALLRFYYFKHKTNTTHSMSITG